MRGVLVRWRRIAWHKSCSEDDTARPWAFPPPWGRLNWRLFFVSSECKAKPLAWVTKMDMQQAIAAKRTSEPPTEPTLLRAADRLAARAPGLYGAQCIPTLAHDRKIQRDNDTEGA